MPLSPDPVGQHALLATLPPQQPGLGPQSAAREDALRQAPGKPVLMLRPARVKVNSTLAHAIAYTVTHVLIERADDSDYDIRWVATWMVRRL
jgi:hypothetical protein